MTRTATTTPPRQRQPRVIDKDYKCWIAQLPCVICGGQPVEVAHVRYADMLYLKEQPGMQAKPDDIWTLPLCPEHHRIGVNAQHSGSERAFWNRYPRKVGPLALCLILRYRCHPDVLLAERVLREWRSA